MVVLAVMSVHAAQSSWSKGSSMETTGNSLIQPWYRAANWLGSKYVEGSDWGFLKSRSYLPCLEYGKLKLG